MSAHLLPTHVNVRNVPAVTLHTHYSQNRHTQWGLMPFRLCLILLLSLFVLVGCGPEKEPAGGDLTGSAIRIAQEYQQTGDLGSARSQLGALDVANPTQFLIFLAEDRADSDPGTPETNALVNFALALGLQSGQLMGYALQNGLIELPATATPVAQVAVAELPTAAPTEVVPTATIPAAVPISETTGSAETATTDVVSDSTTAEQVPAAANPLPTATPVSKPQVQASSGVNVRGGPGTAYLTIGALAVGQQADIVAKNPQGDWWQINLPTGGTGWVLGQLVQTTGDTATVAVATDIPAVPTPVPVAVAPTTAPVAAAPPAEAPAAQEPTAPEPTAEQQPSAPPADVPPGNDFYSIERRLWTVQETGGDVDGGGSVRCGEKRELHVIILDANGNRLNGVAVQAIYGAQEIFVTGSQGKGDGQVEFVLGEGQGVKVIRDADGREVSSDVVDGMTTKSPSIGVPDLISANYCTDEASCAKFNQSAGCWGHHSWTVTFKRKY